MNKYITRSSLVRIIQEEIADVCQQIKQSKEVVHKGTPKKSYVKLSTDHLCPHDPLTPEESSHKKKEASEKADKKRKKAEKYLDQSKRARESEKQKSKQKAIRQGAV